MIATRERVKGQPEIRLIVCSPSLAVKCRSFIQLTPESELGVLWFAIISESLFIAFLTFGFLLKCLELLYVPSVAATLKISSFAAIFTVLAGLLGMVGHMMYTTVFHVTVSLGPKDWKPHSWDYGWSFHMAWFAFTCCMVSSVTGLNAYSKTAAQLKHARRGQESTSPGSRPVLEPEDISFLWERSAFSLAGASDAASGGRNAAAPANPPSESLEGEAC
ncbi:germ cell-specific gene 1-like protein [Scyliorhinus canicula]|uniref:germ cell-specific gene 1-like protein n=1 Tax=Scyliorhinus canicula TaxID=7830 RepID=UPI0018F7BC2E|nr:germ cell-specific gene 1-like protein [Scyliorhinus canicula]